MKLNFKISPAEREVLSVLWRDGPLSTGDLVDRLNVSQGWTRGTTRTLIARLLQKRAVTRRVDGNRHLYRAAIAEKECIRQESRNFLDRVFRGEPASMVLTLVEQTELSPEQIRRLREILDRKER